jgi:hypothetical protein
MPVVLDQQMETASQALGDLDYARCESLCVDALHHARDLQDWVMYQRVLMPLQESRRQRRQAALDGPIMLGTQSSEALVQLVDAITQGCLVVTRPCTIGDFERAVESIHRSTRPIEMLFADNTIDAARWTVTSTAGPDIRIELDAPQDDWLGRALSPSSMTPPTPTHWFMQASEALGDAALAAINAEPGSLAYLSALEDALACVDDHEILHQRLAAAAKALQEAQR